MLREGLPTGWQHVQRVLVIQPGGADEVVMTGPVLRTLKHYLSTVRITLMVSAAGSQIVPFLPWVTDSFVLPTGALAAEKIAPEPTLQLIETLQSYRFDAAVILTNLAQSPYPLAYCCYLAGIPMRLGQSLEFGGSVLSQCITAQEDLHPIDRHLLLLESAGFAIVGRQLELQVPVSVRPQIKELLHRMEQTNQISAEVTAACLTVLQHATFILESARR